MIRDFWVENYYSIRERQEMDFEVRSKDDEWMHIEPTPGVYLSKLGFRHWDIQISRPGGQYYSNHVKRKKRRKQ